MRPNPPGLRCDRYISAGCLLGLAMGCGDARGDAAPTNTSASGSVITSTADGSAGANGSAFASATTAGGTPSGGLTVGTTGTDGGSGSLGTASMGSSSSAATVGAGGDGSATAAATTSSIATGAGGADGQGGADGTGQGGLPNAATSSQTSGGGTGGSNSYQPCPTNGEPCIVLPFGDSITDGVGSTDLAGYRSRLFELAVQANHEITFVGSRSSGPDQIAGQPFPKNHEGHPGWTIDSGYVSYGEGISTLVPEPAFSTMPHIVLLMIGTNDINSDQGTDTIDQRLETLLDDIVATAPDALIVVAVPTPVSWNPESLRNYSARIPVIVEARVARGEHLLVADMSQMPASGLDSDGVHPNDQGYVYMANAWYSVLESVLPLE